jgi:uncharacterized protein (DUF58 family)
VETSELLKKVRKIEIKTRGLSSHVFSGQYHSAFKGKGMAFSEVREYQFGDDIRSIDWNVTARFNHPFVKIFEEERELSVMLLIDVSGSNEFGTQRQLKSQLMTEIAGVLSFSAIYNNDKVGVIFFSDKIEKFIPPQKGTAHILRIIRELINFKPENKGTNISEALRYLTNIIKKRCIAFVLSDFMDKSFHDAFKIANRKHDVIAIHVYDERETNLPKVGIINLKDAESGKSLLIDTSDISTRNYFAKQWNERTNQFKSQFLKSGIDLVSISTNQDYIKPLINLFKKRGLR